MVQVFISAHVANPIRRTPGWEEGDILIPFSKGYRLVAGVEVESKVNFTVHG